MQFKKYLWFWKTLVYVSLSFISFSSLGKNPFRGLSSCLTSLHISVSFCGSYFFLLLGGKKAHHNISPNMKPLPYFLPVLYILFSIRQSQSWLPSFVPCCVTNIPAKLVVCLDYFWMLKRGNSNCRKGFGQNNTVLDKNGFLKSFWSKKKLFLLEGKIRQTLHICRSAKEASWALKSIEQKRKNFLSERRGNSFPPFLSFQLYTAKAATKQWQITAKRVSSSSSSSKRPQCSNIASSSFPFRHFGKWKCVRLRN